MRVFFYLLVSFEFINQMGICQIFSFFFFVGLVLNMTQKALNFSLSFLYRMVNKFVAFAFV